MNYYKPQLNEVNTSNGNLQLHQQVPNLLIPNEVLQLLPQMVDENGSVLLTPLDKPNGAIQGLEITNFEPQKPYFKSVKGYVSDQNGTGYVCRTCCRAIFNKNYYKLYDDHDEINSEKRCTMLQQLVPELDLEIYSEAVICSKCFKMLIASLKFRKMCLETEENFQTWISERKKFSRSNVTLLVLLDQTTNDDIILNREEKIDDLDILPDLKTDNNNVNENLLEANTEDMFSDLDEGEDAESSNLQGLLTGSQMKEKLNEVMEVENKNTTSSVPKPAPRKAPKRKYSYKLKLSSDGVKSKVKRAKPQGRVPKIVACEICGHEFRSFRSYCCHMYSHIDENDSRLKCSFCTYVTDNPKRFSTHLMTHEEKTYKCSKCDKTYSSLNGLNGHYKVKHLGNSYQCHICGKCYSQSMTLYNHSLSHGLENIKSKYECETCGKKFLLTHKYLKHLESHKKPTFKCELCGNWIKNKENLRRHIQIYHKKESKFKCDVCGKCFWHSKGLQTHKLHHYSAYEHVCDVCGCRFSTAGKLKCHVTREHDEKRFECDLCGKKFSSMVGLQNHKKTSCQNKELGGQRQKEIHKDQPSKDEDAENVENSKERGDETYVDSYSASDEYKNLCFEISQAENLLN